jgi:hypothetical protein
MVSGQLNGARVTDCLRARQYASNARGRRFLSDRSMENMIFGEVPDIEQILAVLQTLQEEINA